MAASAAHLVDNVLGGLPVRQWVLTLPHRLRYAMAWDHELCKAVLAVFVRALLGYQRRCAKRLGVASGKGGAVTAIQRFGSAANLNVHFHTLVAQGVFAGQPDGGVRFVPLPAPSDLEVAKLLEAIRRRIVRLVKRRGIELERPQAEAHPVDGLAVEAPVLAEICGASVASRIALGPRSGRPVLRLGRDPDAPWVTSNAPCHAHLKGFDLHANVAVPAGDRARLEHLARYILRPPIAQDALELLPDGNVLLKIRRPWHDGTRAIVFSPSELMEKLAALIPKPRVNLLLYHGVFGPSAGRRRAAVSGARAQSSPVADQGPACRRPASSDSPAQPTDPMADVTDLTGAALQSAEADAGPQSSSPASLTALVGDLAGGSGASARTGIGGNLGTWGERDQLSRNGVNRSPPRYLSWAKLLLRTFEIDILACPGCGGRLQLIATIDDPVVIKKFLAHLGVPSDLPEPCQARPVKDDDQVLAS